MANDSDLYEEAGRAWGVDPALLHAITFHESTDNDQAPGTSGELGRAQFMPATAQRIGITDRTDPVQSVFGAAKLMRQNLDASNGVVTKALLMYNGGGNKAYPSLVLNHLARFTAARTQAQAAPADDAFSQVFGGAQAAPSGAAQDDDAVIKQTVDRLRSGQSAPHQAATSDASDPFSQVFGAVPNKAPPPAATQAPAQAAPPPYQDPMAATAGDPSATISLDPVARVASDVVNTVTAPDYDQRIRTALAPAPNTTYGSVLPLATDNTTGAVRLAMPTVVRDGLQGLYDLSQGPATGTVTPAASNALLGMATGGLGRSVAAGTGAAIGNRLLPAGSAALGRNETPDLLGAELRAAPNALVPSAVGETARNPLVPQAPVSVAPADTAGMPTVQPGMGGPAPDSVGAAATPGGLTGMTPAEVQAYRSTAEGQKLLEPQPRGVPDRVAYVPGVSPTSAETEQSVNLAREQKALGQASPAVSQEAQNVAAENNEARLQRFASLAGSDVDVANAKAARSAQARQDLSAAWSNKTDADISPITQAATDILNSPDGRRPVVRNAVNSVTAELTGPEGQAITDPEMLYGVRKHIDDLMSKEAGSEDPKSVRARANLQVLKDRLDGVIEQAAPGFRQYLQNFANASRSIDEMSALQGHENKLVDTQNRMQYSRVQNMMRQIVDSRSAPGINPYKSISDDTMQRLWNLRDDLRRSATAQELAKTAGSDTGQNLMDAVRYGGNLMAHGAANTLLGPGLGSMVLSGVKQTIAPVMAQRAARRQTARGLNMLRPDRTENPLIPPAADQ